MKELSIIIPCYNAEKYIDKCAEYLFNQTIDIDNLELIFVDDKSTDDTLSHLARIEAAHPNNVLVVACEENGRQGKARNIGLSYASGKYIGFMDQDDYIDSIMYETMLAAANKNEADLVTCKSKKISKEELQEVISSTAENKIDPNRIKMRTIDTQEDRTSFLKDDFNIAIWNKIYKKELLMDNNIFFLEGMIYDDIFFSNLVKQYVRSIAIIDEVFYYHILTGNNASYSNKDKGLAFGYIEAELALIEVLKTRDLYNKNSNIFRDNFIVSYIAFVHSYCIQFGYIELEIWNNLISYIGNLIPDLKNSMYINTEFKTKSSEIIKKSLFNKVTPEYVLALAKCLEEELLARV